MNRSKNNLRFVSGTLLIIGAIAVIFLYAPGYLQYADKPGKSDCVILLLGPNTEARKKEAVQLIKDGYADLLIIPANNKILTASPEKSLQTKKVNPPLEEIDLLKKTNFPVENTNIEILLARKIMDRFSFRSATFVS
ncbi:MAG: hypothetical protein JXM72_04835, partial [Deltaproteobacteria bacterium]|nr:hypothetical protein [Deltaproteobacteria bacterium]